MPSPSMLLDQIAEKDKALVEKDNAYAALEAQSKEMIAMQEHNRRQNLLIGELNHRVKNMLAVVQSIVRQSLRTAHDKEHFAETFEERLMALAHTHTLLLDAGWSTTSFVDLTDRLLTPYGKRFRTSGIDLLLEPQAALSLGMAIHELATNALKYGAWHGCGMVEIDVSQEGEMMVMRWQESGGPEVVPPRDRNFGSKLLHDGVPRELRATASKEFLPQGIVYTLRIPPGGGVSVSGRTPSSFAVSA